MAQFSDLSQQELERLIDVPWEKLHARQADFKCLMAPWKDSQHLHLPATRELLVRNPPKVPDPQSLGLSALGQRYLDGKGASSPADAASARRPSQKVLLMMFGYSTEQLALSIACHYRLRGCRYFVPFCGEDLKEQPGQVASLLRDVFREMKLDLSRDIPPDERVPEIVNDPALATPTRLFLAAIEPDRFFNEIEQTSDPSRVFRTLMTWLKSPPPPFRTADWGFGLEVTGGQKTMDAGATAFASYYGLPAFYLDSEEYDRDLRRPHPKSTRCKLLLLPGASFSHRTREAVQVRIRSCDFAVARALTDDVLASMRSLGSPGLASATAEDASPFFAEDDFRGLAQLQELLDRSQAFMESAYAVPVDGRKSLAQVLGQRPAETEPDHLRKVMEQLLDYVKIETGASPNGDWRIFFDYVADEFYRLETILGEAPESMTDARPQLATQRNYREVLLAGLGLAELILEALIRITGAQTTKHHSMELVKGGKRESKSPDLVPTQSGVAELWHMDYEKKWILVRTGTAKKVPIRLRDDGGVPKFEGSKRSSYFELNADLATRNGIKFTTSLQGDQEKGELWGSPYFAEPWRKARDPMTHMRAPLDDATKRIAVKAVREYLPGMLELLYRMAKDRQPVDCSQAGDLKKWLTWNQPNSEWSRQRRVPWAGKQCQIAKWLAMDLAASDSVEGSEA